MNSNKVDHPSHYNNGASMIARDALEALGITRFDRECIEELEASHAWILRNAYVFNAVKYLWRCGQKGDAVQDLEKALWYIERCIEYGKSKSMGLCYKHEQQPMVRICGAKIRLNSAWLAMRDTINTENKE